MDNQRSTWINSLRYGSLIKHKMKPQPLVASQPDSIEASKLVVFFHFALNLPGFDQWLPTAIHLSLNGHAIAVKSSPHSSGHPQVDLFQNHGPTKQSLVAGKGPFAIGRHQAVQLRQEKALSLVLLVVSCFTSGCIATINY